MFAFGYLTTVTAGLLTYPIDTIRRRQMITSESSYQATKTLICNHGWTSLFAGATMNIYRGMIGALTLAMMDMVKHEHVQYKVVAAVKRKVKAILLYRKKRNQILLNVEGVGNRADWKEIVESVIIKYLDDYMQNEDSFKLKLTDTFAITKWKDIEVDEYLGADLKFHQVVVDTEITE